MSDFKVCPDCAAERGDDGMRPLAEFYLVRAARYKNGVRISAFCKRHTKARNAAALKAAPEGSRLRESQRKAKREWAARNRERIKTNRARWRIANPTKVAAANDRWRRKHPEVRKKSQEAYRERKKKHEAPSSSCSGFFVCIVSRG